MLTTTESQSPTVTGNFYAERLEQTKADILQQVDKFFRMGGITMPMKLLADLFSVFSERIRIEEDEEGFCRDFIADTVFEGTQIMWLLAEMYENYEAKKRFENLIEKGGAA